MQVLLVIILSIVEWFGLDDLRGDGSEPALCQNLKEQPSSAYLGNDRSDMLRFLQRTCSDAAFVVCLFRAALFTACVALIFKA